MMPKWFFFAIALSSCTTYKARHDSIVKGERYKILPSGEIHLESELSKSLFQRLDSDHSTPVGVLKSLDGVTFCDTSNLENLSDCTSRIKTTPGTFDTPVTLGKSLSRALTDFAMEHRSELTSADNILFDLRCQFRSAKSPPYRDDAWRCWMSKPRRLNEAYLSGKVAAEITEAILATTEPKLRRLDVFSALVCKYKKGVPICQIANLDPQVSNPKIEALSPELSRRLNYTLEMSDRYRAILIGGTTGRDYKLPKTLGKTVRCRLPQQLATGLKKQATCIVGLD